MTDSASVSSSPAVVPEAPDPCGRFVYWWEGEYEGNCELPAGHEGDHFDGLSWYDDDMADKGHEHE